MESRSIACITLVLLLFVAVISCGHGGSSPSAPSVTDEPNMTAVGQNSGGGHQLWGYWLIGINPKTNQYEVSPVRQAEDHWNVIKCLEQGPCTDCLKITSMTDSDHGTKLVTVSIEHPFPSPNLTGFDVRGIAMFNGSQLFPKCQLNTSNAYQGDVELINADGYTTLYNSSTADSGPDGLQGYLKGKYSTGQFPDALLNGFKRYETTDPGNTRNAFYAGDTISQVYDLDMSSSPFVFGYAIDVSWAHPTNEPVTDPMTDFPPEANCFEPYKIMVKETDGVLTDQGNQSSGR